MIKIILSGCNGKMGKVITNLVEDSPNLSISAGIDKKDEKSSFPVFANILDCNVEGDVILDFSRPDSLDSLLQYGKKRNIGIIFCTTGYSEEAQTYFIQWRQLQRKMA